MYMHDVGMIHVCMLVLHDCDMLHVGLSPSIVIWEWYTLEAGDIVDVSDVW